MNEKKYQQNLKCPIKGFARDFSMRFGDEDFGVFPLQIL